MKVLITGGNGYIGSSLLPALKERGYDVMPFEGRVENYLDWKRNVPNRFKFDAIIHLAAQTSLRKAEEDPIGDFEVNVMGTSYGLDNCSTVTRFILASTVTVEGVTDYSIPHAEARICRPASMYEAHKYTAEMLAGKEYQTVFRLCNVYGASLAESRSDRGIVNQFIRKGMKGETIQVYRSVADKVRDCIYISDVIDAFVRWVEMPAFPSGTYNVCTGDGHTIKDIADMCGNVDVVDDPDDLHLIEKRSWVGDYSKLNKACGWMPKIMLKYGIQRTWEAFGELSRRQV